MAMSASIAASATSTTQAIVEDDADDFGPQPIKKLAVSRPFRCSIFGSFDRIPEPVQSIPDSGHRCCRFEETPRSWL